MKHPRLKPFLIFSIILIAHITHTQPKIDVNEQMQMALDQYKRMLEVCKDSIWFPQSVLPDGQMKMMKSDWWCSGFLGGSLWYLYEYTHDPVIKSGAEKWTKAVAKEQFNTGTHDLGFMLYCPFGNGYRITQNDAYVPVLLKGAESLSTRFDPDVGLMKSWNDFEGYSYPVIIDNMMNLELLFWAAKTSGNRKYYDIAVTHADNTIRNHFREDNSSYHVLCYDQKGNVIERKTAQGYSDESAWARGQAWGLYGFVVTYRETKDKRYLDQAVKIADFITRHPNLSSDKIPYWDFNSPDIPNDVRDASAAAITSSALLELCRFVNDEKRDAYFSFAESVLVTLSSPAYFAADGNHYFLLKHSTGHKPAKSEVDTPIIYADYYYLEALSRYKNLVEE